MDFIAIDSSNAVIAQSTRFVRAVCVCMFCFFFRQCLGRLCNLSSKSRHLFVPPALHSEYISFTNTAHTEYRFSGSDMHWHVLEWNSMRFECMHARAILKSKLLLSYIHWPNSAIIFVLLKFNRLRFDMILLWNVFGARTFWPLTHSLNSLLCSSCTKHLHDNLLCKKKIDEFTFVFFFW